MSWIILSQKAIAGFQQSLRVNLETSRFTQADADRVVEQSTKMFESIARAHALKPKQLPDGGLNVMGAINTLLQSKNTPGSYQDAIAAITKNPELLFAHHDIKVPEIISNDVPAPAPSEKKYKTTKKSRQAKTNTTKNKKITIAEIVDAAQKEYARTKRRPDVLIDDIAEGALKDEKWSRIYQRFKNPKGPYIHEGFETLGEVFDLAMVGRRNKPANPEDAQKAFAESFRKASVHISTQSPTAELPYVFQMAEKSLVAMMAKKNVDVISQAVIDEGPLRELSMTVEALDQLFSDAAKATKSFPYKNLYGFINKRNLIETAKIAILESPDYGA